MSAGSWLQDRAPLLATDRNFRWLWASQVINYAGDWLGYIALMLYVFNLTGSGTAIAGLAAFEALPAMLLGPWAGIVADRFPRKRVMIAASLGQAVLMVALPFTQNLWAIYALALGTRLLGTFFYPAHQALLPDLVEKSELETANSLLSLARSTTMIVGPALGGALVAWSGARWAFWADGLSFALSAVCIAAVVVPRRGPMDEKGREGDNWLSDLRVGLAYTRASPAVLVLLASTFFVALGGASLNVLEVVYVKDVLKAGDTGYGLLISVAGLGGLAGSLLVKPARRWVTVVSLFCWAELLGALSFFPYANIPIFPITLAIVFAQVIAFVLAGVMADTLLQSLVESGVRGRVFSLVSTLSNGVTLLSIGIFGPAIDHFGVVPIFNASGVILTIGALYVFANARILEE